MMIVNIRLPMRNPVLSTCVAAERSRRMNIDSPYAIGLAPSRPTRSAPRTAPSRVPIDRCKEGVQASLNDGCAITRVVIGAQNVADSQPNRATNSDRTAPHAVRKKDKPFALAINFYFRSDCRWAAKRDDPQTGAGSTICGSFFAVGQIYFRVALPLR
jgi:hypothetical protein